MQYLPPRKLYHTVFLYKNGSKLILPLFSTCADTMNQGNYAHSHVERCIVGTWVLDLVRKAIDVGYGLVDVFEFWECSVL